MPNRDIIRKILLTNDSNKIINLYDEFFGTSINTSKWTITDPALGDGVSVAVNDGIEFNLTHTNAVPKLVHYITSVDNFNNSLNVLSFDFVSYQESISQGQGECLIFWDSSNYIQFLNLATGGQCRMNVVVGGVNIGQQTISGTNQRIKVVYNKTNQLATMYYWNATTWTAFGASVATTSIPSTAFNIVFTCGDQVTYTGGGKVKFSSCYLTNYDYSTFYPSTIDNNIDPYSLQFSSLSSYTDSTTITALSTKIKSDRKNGIWFNKIAMYPLVGASSTITKYNIRNPSRSITWNGTITHDANGVKSNGTTGYGTTGIIPSTFSLTDSIGFSATIKENNINAVVVIGVQNSGTQRASLVSRSTGDLILADIFNVTATQGRLSKSNTNQSGRISAQRRSATDFEAYRNASSLGSITTSGGTVPTLEYYLLGLNNVGVPAVTLFPDTVQFANIYCKGLTGAQETIDRNSESTFLTAIGR